jgi:hypothetical protein
MNKPAKALACQLLFASTFIAVNARPPGKFPGQKGFKSALLLKKVIHINCGKQNKPYPGAPQNIACPPYCYKIKNY